MLERFGRVAATAAIRDVLEDARKAIRSGAPAMHGADIVRKADDALAGRHVVSTFEVAADQTLPIPIPTPILIRSSLAVLRALGAGDAGPRDMVREQPATQ